MSAHGAEHGGGGGGSSEFPFFELFNIKSFMEVGGEFLKKAGNFFKEFSGLLGSGAEGKGSATPAAAHAH